MESNSSIRPIGRPTDIHGSQCLQRVDHCAERTADYTLRLVGENGTASIKYLRLTGTDAFAELQAIWRTFTFLSEKFGVPFVT